MLVNFAFLLDLGLDVLVLRTAKLLGPISLHVLLAPSLLDHLFEGVDSVAHLRVELGLHGLNVELDVLAEGHEHVEGLGHVLVQVLFVHLDGDHAVGVVVFGGIREG